MSPALRIVAGLQFGQCPHAMANALCNVIALADPLARANAYRDAGFDFSDMPVAKYVALDQQATHIEIERRVGVAA